MKTAVIIISVLYAILVFATIKVMYKNQQNKYVCCKMISSGLFLLIGFLAYRASENPLYFSFLPAFVLCFLGDLFLGLGHEIDNRLKNPQFTLGVGSFLIAHIFFCWQFLKMMDYRIGWTAAVSVIMVIVSIFSVRSKKYDYGSNKVPSVIYSFFVGLLCGLGIELLLSNEFSPAIACLGIGSICFLASDYMLSLKYFRIKKPKCLGALVLITYYAAMGLFSVAVMM